MVKTSRGSGVELRYVTHEDVELQPGQSLVVPIEAVAGGLRHNLAPGQIQTLERARG